LASRRAPVVTALLTVQVLFGFHYIGAKIVLAYLPPMAWAAIRALTAAAVLVPLAVLRKRRWPVDPRDHARLAFYAIFGVAINQSFFVLGLSRTVPSHSALINTSIPVATLLFAILAGRERPTRWKVGGIALSLAGVLYLLGHSGASLGGGILAGDLLTLVNALSYSLFLVISKPILEKYRSDVVTAMLLFYGSLYIGVAGLWQVHPAALAAMPARAWWWGLFVILFPTIGAYLLNAYALKRVESSMVALFIYVQPLIAASLAFVMLGDRITVHLVGAAALIFLGVYLAVKGRTRDAAAATTATPTPLPPRGG
jgi:drug/metabolite transporter (DMT)-like permease